VNPRRCKFSRPSHSALTKERTPCVIRSYTRLVFAAGLRHFWAPFKHNSKCPNTWPYTAEWATLEFMYPSQSGVRAICLAAVWKAGPRKGTACVSRTNTPPTLYTVFLADISYLSQSVCMSADICHLINFRHMSYISQCTPWHPHNSDRFGKGAVFLYIYMTPCWLVISNRRFGEAPCLCVAVLLIALHTCVNIVLQLQPCW